MHVNQYLQFFLPKNSNLFRQFYFHGNRKLIKTRHLKNKIYVVIQSKKLKEISIQRYK